jgi:hypothetical protein
MKVFATIEKRRARVSGFKYSGWQIVDDSTPLPSMVSEVEFTIKIIGDGADGFLLDYKSNNGEFCADSSHQTMSKAFELASEMFGVTASDWLLGPNTTKQK